jgi:hypothetical protein
MVFTFVGWSPAQVDGVFRMDTSRAAGRSAGLYFDSVLTRMRAGTA